MAESSVIPFEGLKNLVAALNKLFSVLFSFQEEFAVREINVKVDRQMTVYQKMVLATSVLVTLEPQDVTEWKGIQELIATLRKEGFGVYCPKEVEVKVSLPPISLTA